MLMVEQAAAENQLFIHTAIIRSGHKQKAVTKTGTGIDHMIND